MSSSQSNDLPNPARPELRSLRQMQVLTATKHATDRTGGPCSEYHISKAGREMGYWEYLSLASHLRTLSDRGLLARLWVQGRYHYALSDAGRRTIADGH